MDEIKRDAFIFFRSYKESLDHLPDDMRGRMYTAIAEFALDGVEPKLEGVEMAIWLMVRPNLLISRKRANAGSNGGYRKKANTKQTDSKRVGNDKQNCSKTLANTKQTDSKRVGNKDKDKDKDKGYKEEESICSSLHSEQNSLSLDKPSSLCSEGSSEDETSDAEIHKQEAESFDIREFVLFFNSEIEKANSNIPKIVKLTNQRKGFLLARLREYSVENLMIAVTKAATSEFLNGNNSRGWIADFAWIFRPNNFPKVLEGNYDNKKYYGKNRHDNSDHSQSRIKSDIISSAQTAMLRVVNGMESEAPEL